MHTHWKNGKAPQTPYYAVIFISQKKEDLTGYEDMNNKTMELALALPGCLGYSSVPGMFISYWGNKESIDAWSNDQTHQKAKEQGIKNWYKYYHIQICKVEHSHEFFFENQGL